MKDFIFLTLFGTGKSILCRTSAITSVSDFGDRTLVSFSSGEDSVEVKEDFFEVLKDLTLAGEIQLNTDSDSDSEA